MDENIEALLDKYHYNKLDKKELELFYLSLELNSKLSEAFKLYLRHKYLLNDNFYLAVKFLLGNKLSLER